MAAARLDDDDALGEFLASYPDRGEGGILE
jgi:hypothetical protein